MTAAGMTCHPKGDGRPARQAGNPGQCTGCGPSEMLAAREATQAARSRLDRTVASERLSFRKRDMDSEPNGRGIVDTAMPDRVFPAYPARGASARRAVALHHSLPRVHHVVARRPTIMTAVPLPTRRPTCRANG